MKGNAFTLFTVYTIAFGSFAVAALGGFAVGQMRHISITRSHHQSFVLQQVPKALKLSGSQHEKVQRIVDQAQPQIVAAQDEYRQRKRTVVDAALSEISSVLTPDQQKQLDELQKARNDLHRAQDKLNTALNASATF